MNQAQLLQGNLGSQAMANHRCRLPKRYSVAGSLISISVLWGQCAIAGSLIGLVSVAPVLAPESQTVQAEIRKLRNQVQLLPHQKMPRSAKVTDVLLPLDAVRTGEGSMAELLFDRGAFLRIGSNSLFRFAPRKRQLRHLDVNGIRAETTIHLEQGVALITLPSGASENFEQGVQLDLPQSLVSIAPALPMAPDATPAGSEPEVVAPDPAMLDGDVLAVYDPSNQTDYVIALSDKTIQVSDRAGKQSVLVPVGHLVAIANGTVQPPKAIDVNEFTRDSPWNDVLTGYEPEVTTDPEQADVALKLPGVAPVSSSNSDSPGALFTPVEPSIELFPIELPSTKPSTDGSRPRPENVSPSADSPIAEILIDVPVPQHGFERPPSFSNLESDASPEPLLPEMEPPLVSKPLFLNSGWKLLSFDRIGAPSIDSLIDQPVEPPLFVVPQPDEGSFPKPIDWYDDDSVSSIPEPSAASGLLLLTGIYLAYCLKNTIGSRDKRTS